MGCRGSRLSLVQTGIVIDKLRSAGFDARFDIIKIKTTNELIDRESRETVKDIYTKEIDRALMDGSIDIAVHSLKDVRMDIERDLLIAAIPDRDDPRDVFISKDGTGFGSMRRGSVIGTSSIRRRILLSKLNPGVSIEDIHGNVDTRMERMRAGDFDGLVLAAAGLRRLGIDIGLEYLDVDRVVPAIGQGALAVMARRDDQHTIDMLSTVNVESLMDEIEAERAFGRFFGVGCRYPIGANARASNGSIDIVGFIYDERSERAIIRRLSGSELEPESLGIELAKEIRAEMR